MQHSYSAMMLACQSDMTAPSNARMAAAMPPNGTSTASRSANGAASQQPAYYDGQFFTVNMKPLTTSAAAALIAHHAPRICQG